MTTPEEQARALMKLHDRAVTLAYERGLRGGPTPFNATEDFREALRAALAGQAPAQPIRVLNALEVLDRMKMDASQPTNAATVLRIMGEAGMWVIANPLAAGFIDFSSALTLFGKESPRPVGAWQPIETAPTNQRVIVVGLHRHFGHEVVAMGWKDRIDGEWYYAPDGGLLSFAPLRWTDYISFAGSSTDSASTSDGVGAPVKGPTDA